MYWNAENGGAEKEANREKYRTLEDQMNFSCPLRPLAAYGHSPPPWQLTLPGGDVIERLSERV